MLHVQCTIDYPLNLYIVVEVHMEQFNNHNVLSQLFFQSFGSHSYDVLSDEDKQESKTSDKWKKHKTILSSS